MHNLEKALLNKRILVIDDLVEARSAMKKMLVILGANKIDVVGNGDEATALIAQHDYDIVLCDYNLAAGKDGQQVLEEARFTKRLKESALFIMVTGESSLEMVMGALEYEPDNYISKPYTLNTLKERMARILKIKLELKDVNAAIDQGNIEQAIALAEASLAANPRRIIPLTRVLGRLYQQQHNYQAALDAYERLLKLRSITWARLGQAICYYYLGNPKHALNLIDDLLKEHPLYVQCYDWAARILFSLNDLTAAQEKLEKGLEISPKAILRQMEYGKIALLNNNLQSAHKAYDRAIKLARFSCYRNSDNYLKFVDICNRLLASKEVTDPQEIKELMKKSFARMKEVNRLYVGQNDVMFDARIIESQSQLVVGDSQQAKVLIDEAEHFLKKIEHQDHSRDLQLAKAFVGTDQLARADSIINKVANENPAPEIKQELLEIVKGINPEVVAKHLRALNNRGMKYYDLGNYAEAVTLFNEAVLNPKASPSMLLNAIQTKISLMENDGINHSYLDDCKEYFERIGDLDKSDSLYPRYKSLKLVFNKLIQTT